MGIFSRLLKKRKKRSDEEISKNRLEMYTHPGVFEINPSEYKTKNKRKLKRRKDKKDEYEISRDRVKNLIKWVTTNGH